MVHFKEITKEGLEQEFNFNEFMERLIYFDVCEVLKKESYLLKEIYQYCFYYKEQSIQEYLEMQKSEEVENVEDFIKEATQKIESARQLCINNKREGGVKYGK